MTKQITLYTIDDHGEITSGLTAVDAAEMLLTDDGYQYEVRQDDDGGWTLYVSRESRNSYGGGRALVRSVIYSIESDEQAATAEIMEKVIRSGHWTKGELDCRTDEQHAAMMAELAADEAREEV